MEYLTIVGHIASIIGVAIGFPALLFALQQLNRTEIAAKAAQTSAEQTLDRITSIVAVASIEQICNRSRQLLLVMNSKNLSGSAMAALELRESVARFSRLKAAQEIQADHAWKTLLTTVAGIHDALIAAAAINRIDTDSRNELIRSATEIHIQLNVLTGIATDKAGGF